jgi:aldose 1-epimerase
MKKLTSFLLFFAMLSCMAPSGKQDKTQKPVISEEAYDTMVDGKAISLYHLQNANGIDVYLTNFGARVVSLITPDKNGKFADVALGYADIGGYLNDKMYLGCIVGRFANRINEAKFTLNGKEYHLFKNDGDNTLHGGKSGLDKKIWEAKQDSNSVTFSYLSPDGEEGYPGNLSLSVKYTLNNDNELMIEYEAETDQATVINLSNHTYINLKGEGDTTILDHFVEINADYYTPIDAEWIPTGEIAPVEGTPFDFRNGKTIGRDINQDNEQLKNGKGYDHNWVLYKDEINSMTFAAKMWDEMTGRYIAYYTTEPGMQFYCGNFMNGTVIGKSGRPYKYRSALIFETQHFPDTPNHDNFPSTVLNPGDVYHHTAIMKFGVLGDEE